jgi:hypothetical protein
MVLECLIEDDVSSTLVMENNILLMPRHKKLINVTINLVTNACWRLSTHYDTVGHSVRRAFHAANPEMDINI